MNKDLSLLVDSSYGLIKDLYKLNRYPNQPRLWVYTVIEGPKSNIGDIVGSGIRKVEAVDNTIKDWMKYYSVSNVKENIKGKHIKLNKNEEVSYKDVDNKLLHGIGISNDINEAVELAINDVITKFIISKLKKNNVKLSKINITEIDELKKFYENYMGTDFQFELYRVNDYRFPIVIGSGIMIDGKNYLIAATGKDLKEACKRAFLNLGEVHIIYANDKTNILENVVYNKIIKEEELELENRVEKSIEIERERILECCFEQMFKDAYVFRITPRDIKQLGYEVIKIYMKN